MAIETIQAAMFVACKAMTTLKPGSPDMRWPKRLIRQRRDPDMRFDDLEPLLSMLEASVPPEGLLRGIESHLDCKTDQKQPVLRVRFALVLTAIAGMSAILAANFLPGPDRTALVDPAGLARVELLHQSNSTTVKVLGHPKMPGESLGWYLWGFDGETAVPVPLGPLQNKSLTIQSPEQFLRFAMSLEPLNFSGNQPTGPVISLVRFK